MTSELLSNLQYCFWNSCPPEKAWFGILLVGLTGLAVFFFFKYYPRFLTSNDEVGET